MNSSQRLSRAQIVLGVIAVVIGVWAFASARHVGFTASRAPRLGPARYQFQAMSFNRLGALVVVGLGVIGAVAGALRRPMVALLAAVGFGLMGLQVLVQWRPSGTNWFASVGSDLSFAMLLCVGFAVTAAVSRLASPPTAAGRVRQPEVRSDSA